MGVIFRTSVVFFGWLAIAVQPGITYWDAAVFLAAGALFQWGGGRD